MKSTGIIFAVLLIFLGSLAGAETITTTDGRTIQLNKDGTYVILNSTAAKAFEPVDMDALNLDAESWVEKKVDVGGYLKISGTRGDSGMFSKTLSGTDSFKADLTSIPSPLKRRLLNSCKLQCRVSLQGTFLKYGSFDYKIKVQEVVFP